MSTAESMPRSVTSPDQIPGVDIEQLPDLKVYSHSRLFYWWPVWVVGYIFAAITWFHHVKVPLPHGGGTIDVLIDPNKNLGVLFTLIFMLVVLFTNVSLRGLLSVAVILTVMFLTVLFAYLGWWDTILGWIPYLAIYMNMGFYVFFSTGLLIMWVLAFFVFDRMHFWRVRPGQMMVEYVIGGAEKSYDTRGIVVESLPKDLFRHWILGLGAGDIRVLTSGPRSEEFIIPNVTFSYRKVLAIQKLVAVKPDQLMGPKA